MGTPIKTKRVNWDFSNWRLKDLVQASNTEKVGKFRYQDKNNESATFVLLKRKAGNERK